MTGTGVELVGVSKSYGDTVAVDDLSLTIDAGTFTALLGPSGCGKSTTLSMLAGLAAPDTGDVRFAGTSVLGVPTERRPVGLVFQKPMLFPHLSVADNVGFGLRMRGVTTRGRARAVGEVLERVQLDGLGNRRVGQLSGGQEQRVALARALVLEPRVMLLDEPFSQLDSTLRGQMRTLLRQLHDESEVTTVFVTHDQAEAIEVADSIALMLGGTLAGHGPPHEFYTQPASLAAARFFGVGNEIRGRVSGGRFTARCSPVPVSTDAADGDAVLVIRPEAVRLVHLGGDGQQETCSGSRWATGVVTGAQFAGTYLRVDLDLGGQPLRAQVPVGRRVSVGEAVAVDLPPGACTVFTRGGA